MKKRIVLFSGLLLCFYVSIVPSAHADVAVVKDSDKRVELTKHDGRDLLHVTQAADAWKWTIKIIGEGEGDARLIAVCRDTICIPLTLKDTAHLETKAGIFVDAETLGRVMGFKLTRNNDRVVLMPADGDENPSEMDVPAYHDAWGKDRGFRKGQTLPDIPLVDLEGREVRFGQFLGKQYIIYGWASW